MNANDIIILQRSADNSYNRELRVIPENGKVISFDSQLNPLLKSVPGGSGATYKVAYWSDSTNLDDASFLHVDPTNSRLGINNTKPGYAIDVNGNINLSSDKYYKIAGVNTIPDNTYYVGKNFNHDGIDYINNQMHSTINSALDAAAGTSANPAVIIVCPGEYDERIALPSYTHIYFMPGAVLKNTENLAGVLILALNASYSSITGHGVIQYDTIPLNTLYAYHQSGGNVVFEMDMIWGDGHTGILIDGGGSCDMKVNIISGARSVVHCAGGALRITANMVDRIKSSQPYNYTPTSINANIQYVRKIECAGGELFRIDAQQVDGTYPNEGIVCTDGRLEVFGAKVLANSGEHPDYAVYCSGGELLLKNLNIKCSTSSRPAISFSGGVIFADSCTISAPNNNYAVDGMAGMPFYNWNCYGCSLNAGIVNPVIEQRISSPVFNAFIDDII